MVPAIASCVAVKQYKEARGIAESSLRTATVVVLPMCVGLAVLAYPIVNVLWPGSHLAGPVILHYLGPAAFFVCLTMLTNALLQATGRERMPMISMVCGGLAKVLVNWALIGNPRINVLGAAVSSIVCFAVMAGMNILFLGGSRVGRPRLSRFLLRPLASTAVMGLGAWGVYGLLARALTRMGPHGPVLGRMPMMLALAGAILAAVIVYLVMVVLTRAVTAEDLKLMPKGEKLASLLHIR